MPLEPGVLIAQGLIAVQLDEPFILSAISLLKQVVWPVGYKCAKGTLFSRPKCEGSSDTHDLILDETTRDLSTPTVQWSLDPVVSPYPGGRYLATQTFRGYDPLPRAMMTTVNGPSDWTRRARLPGGP